YCVFSPFSTAEVARVLKDNGCFINVHPGPQHLFKLREQVYDQPQPHTPKPAELDHLIHSARNELHYSIHVRRGDTANLLAMTPYYWQASADKQQQIAELSALETPVDFIIDQYRPVLTGPSDQFET
ncbi:MAG: hypothetical protein MI754_13155, partial [Chromatiales bacterium]|nr:hypothetical protein [Chromatiales bacterium]